MQYAGVEARPARGRGPAPRWSGWAWVSACTTCPRSCRRGSSNGLPIARALVEPAAADLGGRTHRAPWTRKTSEDTMRLLAELSAARGMTVVLVTHEPEVAAWARRKLVFRDGLYGG